MNKYTKGEINCLVYDCFCHLAGGRHDENQYEYGLKQSVVIYLPYSFSSLLGVCDTRKLKYVEEIHHQLIHSKYSIV